MYPGTKAILFPIAGRQVSENCEVPHSCREMCNRYPNCEGFNLETSTNTCELQFLNEVLDDDALSYIARCSPELNF